MKLRQLVLAFSLAFMSNNESVAYAQPVQVHNGAYMSYSRSRANGEMDLINLAHTNCFEDLWLYNSGKWYDVGKNENPSEVEQDTDRIESILSNASGPVYEYHTHPHDYCPFPDVDGISLEAVSWQDVIAHVYLAERAKAHGLVLYSRVADEHGIWSYTVDQEMYDDIVANNEPEVLRMIRDVQAGSYSLLNMPRAHFQQILDDYIESQRQKGIIFSYRRYR